MISREEKIRYARNLHDQGLSYAAIGRELGVTGGCVQKWLKPDRAKEWARRENNKPGRTAQKRAWADANRATCPRCGAEMVIGSRNPSKRPDLCRNCRRDEDHTLRETRRGQIAALWNAGKTAPEIAAELGSTAAAIHVAVVAMRKDGWDVPPHYAAHRERMAA